MIPSPSDSANTSSSSCCSLVPRWRPPSHPHGKPRQKRHHNKSRDGCSTCRRRRVKCDEQRPYCKECLKRGLDCEYTGTSPVPQFIQSPSSPLSYTHLDLTDLSFFLENSLDLLTFSPHKFLDSQLALTSYDFPDSCHTRFSKFYKSLILPVAYNEPALLELISIFARRHRLALTAPRHGVTDYLQMLAVMTKLINDSPDITILGASVFFVFERLNSASTGDEPADQNDIHYNAVVKLLPRTSEAIASQILPILNLTWKLNELLTENSGDELVEMPDRIENSTQARQCFSDVLRSADIRYSLEGFLTMTLQYYKDVRGKDWQESRAALAILTEARYLRTVLELNFELPIARGQSEGLHSTPTTISCDSP